MIVRDLMTTHPLSVLPTVPVRAIVELLSEHGISGVPVLDSHGVLLGVVTESDLLRRLSLPDEPRRGWFRGMFDDQDLAAVRYARAHGMTARDVMTTQLWTIGDDSTAGHAARLLEEHGVRRLPVVRDDRLVGMISRADLLRALLPAAPPEDIVAITDETIRTDLAEGMRRQAWAHAPLLFFDVNDGVVELQGQHRSPAIRQAVSTLIANIPGVRRVIDNASDPLLRHSSA
jgi:CBS domain-containing protein